MILALLAALTFVPSASALDPIEPAFAQAQAVVKAVSAPCATVADIRLAIWKYGASPVTYTYLSRRTLLPELRLAHKLVGGTARNGTKDKGYDSSLDDAAYQALLKTVNTSQFFTLGARYSDPKSKDGTTTIVTVVCADGRSKSVSDSNQAGPAALVSIEQYLQNLGESLFWVD